MPKVEFSLSQNQASSQFLSYPKGFSRHATEFCIANHCSIYPSCQHVGHATAFKEPRSARTSICAYNALMCTIATAWSLRHWVRESLSRPKPWCMWNCHNRCKQAVYNDYPSTGKDITTVLNFMFVQSNKLTIMSKRKYCPSKTMGGMLLSNKFDNEHS